ncbi:SIMPL domain-containing protein [uncultured Croceitalea sp.]|uniref:SIMPL domain-containing protein n=1 Tax=uncultured Croceitalea sp. TaxID=1798908 RepID=UPI00374FCAAA
MKKLVIVLVLLCSFWSTAQQRDVKNNTISVSGRALVERTITLYRAKVSLNMEQLYYSDPTCKSLDDLKEKYFKDLKTNGIDPSEFVEKKMEFLTYGYQREGTVLVLETSSKDKIEKLAKVKMTGITIQYQVKSEIKPEQRTVLLKNSLANARENAERVCKVTGKKLGEVISISDSSIQYSTWNSYHNGYEEYTTIYVTYAME